MRQNKNLNDREFEVLQTIVYEYIITSKPVGSRSFVKKYSFSISPATMRNIMSDLEDLGYLVQPHTSAGRIPTDQGYRLYVNSLLNECDFSKTQDVNVNEDMIHRELQLDKIFSYITKMLSGTSKYAGIMITPQLDFTIVKRIELIPLDNNEILLILITRTGMVINKKITVTYNLSRDDLYNYSSYLTSVLSGYTINTIKNIIFNDLRENSLSEHQQAIDIVELALQKEDESELCIDGVENLLKIPEMVEPDRLNSLLNIIEEKDILKGIMENTLKNDYVNILIGDEIENEKVFGCSMVTAAYYIGNKNVGVLGIIGPTRMDYEKVVPLVDYTRNIVSDLLTKISQ